MVGGALILERNTLRLLLCWGSMLVQPERGLWFWDGIFKGYCCVGEEYIYVGVIVVCVCVFCCVWDRCSASTN